MIKLNPVFFLRGNQYLLEALFFIRQHDKFKIALSNLENITQEKWFPKDDNVESLTFLYIDNPVVVFLSFSSLFILKGLIIENFEWILFLISPVLVLGFAFTLTMVRFWRTPNRKIIANISNQ